MSNRTGLLVRWSHSDRSDLVADVFTGDKAWDAPVAAYEQRWDYPHRLLVEPDGHMTGWGQGAELALEIEEAGARPMLSAAPAATVRAQLALATTGWPVTSTIDATDVLNLAHSARRHLSIGSDLAPLTVDQLDLFIDAIRDVLAPWFRRPAELAAAVTEAYARVTR